MKKIDEGVELFDDIWEKVYATEQQNQKEKYEMDLKKEIKKLQRLRDQVKTWIGGSEVKDKDPLLEARKLIETKMEMFKICEKETKTKTYSKEGLAREEKLDPAEEAKLNTVTWIQEYIEKLQELVEEADFEIEKLGKKKSSKSKVEELNHHILNHKSHVSKLEGIIRLVNNDRLDAELVDSLRDDFDYYLDSFEDEDYMQAYDEDYFYETLGLDELDVVNVDHLTQISNSNKKSDESASYTSSKGGSNEKKSKKSALASVIPITIGRATKKTAKELKEETPVKPARGPMVTSKSEPTPAIKSPTSGPTVPATPSTPSVVPTNGASMAAILKRETEQQEKERQKVSLRHPVFRRARDSLLTHFATIVVGTATSSGATSPAARSSTTATRGVFTATTKGGTRGPATAAARGTKTKRGCTSEWSWRSSRGHGSTTGIIGSYWPQKSRGPVVNRTGVAGIRQCRVGINNSSRCRWDDGQEHLTAECTVRR